MYQKTILVKPNRAVITRTVIPAKPEPLRYTILSYIETAAVGVMIGLAIMFLIAVVGIITGCTIFTDQQAEQDVATSTIDDELERFRQQSHHANETLATMKAYAAEGGVQ